MYSLIRSPEAVRIGANSIFKGVLMLIPQAACAAFELFIHTSSSSTLGCWLATCGCADRDSLYSVLRQENAPIALALANVVSTSFCFWLCQVLYCVVLAHWQFTQPDLLLYASINMYIIANSWEIEGKCFVGKWRCFEMRDKPSESVYVRCWAEIRGGGALSGYQEI